MVFLEFVIGVFVGFFEVVEFVTELHALVFVFFAEMVELFLHMVALSVFFLEVLELVSELHALVFVFFA